MRGERATACVRTSVANWPKAMNSLSTVLRPMMPPTYWVSFQGTPMTQARGRSSSPMICWMLRCG